MRPIPIGITSFVVSISDVFNSLVAFARSDDKADVSVPAPMKPKPPPVAMVMTSSDKVL